MTDEKKLKLAGDAATEFADRVRKGKRDTDTYARIWQGYRAGYLAAINALDPQLVEAVGLLRDIFSGKIDVINSESGMNKVGAFLAKQGDAAMAGEKQ